MGCQLDELFVGFSDSLLPCLLFYCLLFVVFCLLHGDMLIDNACSSTKRL